MANDQPRAKMNNTYKDVSIAQLWHVKVEV